MSEAGRLVEWGIVEVFGHNKIAGRLSEETHFGTTMLRVDVPEVDGREAFTRFYGGSAIYSVTLTSEAIARRAVEVLRRDPVTVYGVVEPERQIVATVPDDEDLYPDEEEAPQGFVEETEIPF